MARIGARNPAVIRIWAGISILACSVLPEHAVAAKPPNPLERDFSSPPADVRPWVRWWWPGGDVNQGEIDRELGLLKASGFGGGEIQPFNPGIPNLTADERRAVNDYATPSFFQAVNGAAEAASVRGLQLDYTFGSAWPSGGGLAITPELALVELTVSMRSVTAADPAPIKIEWPARSKRLGAMSPLDARTKTPEVADWRERMDARKKLIAIVAVQGTAPDMPTVKNGGFKLFPFGVRVTRPGDLVSGTAVVLTDKLRPDGTLDWRPPAGEWQLFVFAQYAANTSVMAGVGPGPQLVLDHFKKEAFEAHAHRVGDPLAEVLGKGHLGLRGTFIDSLELMQDLYWSEDFLSEFQRRRGYDLTPFLPLVLQPGWMEAWDDHYSLPCYTMGGVGQRVRADYQQTVSELLYERFVEPFVQWNRAHGMVSRFQAHGGPLDILRAYGAADIPETEDLYESADPYFMKLARSGADLYGRTIVSAESFVWQGRPFSVTPTELRQRADLIFASGVNQIVAHGFPYAFHQQTWPGWYPFAPSPFGPGFSTFLSESNPVWPAVSQLANYMARTQAVLRAGRPVVPVALYLETIGYFKGIEDAGAGDHRVEKGLLASGFDIDRINPDALEHSTMRGSRLLSAGGTEYQALVLPPLDALSVDAANRIATLAREGLRVIFIDHTPSQARSNFEPARGDEEVRKAVASILSSGGRVVPRADMGHALMNEKVVPNLHFVGDAEGVLFVERDVGGRAVYFVHNPDSKPRDASFDTEAPGRVERWDALTGTMALQPAAVAGSRTRVRLELEAGASALLVFNPERPARTYQSPRLDTIAGQPLGQTGWKLHVSGHVRGEVLENDFPAVELSDWSSVPGLGNFSGTGTYSRSFVVDPRWLRPRRQVRLNLGEFHDLATVTLNGHAVGQLWDSKPIEIGAYLKPGTNEVSIQIAAVPNNALVGSHDLGYAALKTQAAGLVGPVQLELQTR